MPDDRPHRLLLQLPQAGVERVRRRRRPAQQRVGVEVAQEHRGDAGAHGAEGRARGGGGCVVGGEIVRAADQGGERDEVLFCCVAGGGYEVPFEGEGVREEGLGQGEEDGFFGGGVFEWAGVEVDLVVACGKGDH